MQKARLSVNINKYALVRNSRGHGVPDLREVSDRCLAAGAHGITVHPRRDERHIRLSDVGVLLDHLAENHPGVELNMECEDHPTLVDLAVDLRPAQVTLVPVTPGEVTSDHGWDLPGESARLEPTIARLREAGIRVSLFIDPTPDRVDHFARLGADCVEIYTGPYAWAWGTAGQTAETTRVHEAGAAAAACGLRVHAGHDLDRHNLAGLRGLPWLAEVSIGHAQICRALEVGTDQSVRELLSSLGW